MPASELDTRTASQADDLRHSDYERDVHKTEARAVSTEFDPRTGERLRRGVLWMVAILAAAFVLVSLARFVKARGVAAASEQVFAALRPVDVIRAQPVGEAQSFSLPGQTAAWHSSTIYARVNGYVGRWLADLGDHVSKGQLLAVIETPELDAELAAARAQLAVGEAQVEVRRAERELARTTYERWRDSPQGVVSEQEREQKRADYESATARLKSAQAEVALSRARVEQYAALAEYKRVTAPFEGVISERYIDIGNLVTAGSTSATTPLYVMTQNDPMRVFVDVPQSAAPELMSGAIPVRIQAGSPAAHTYTGKVARTSGALHPQARTLRVEVDIASAEPPLVPGMYVKVAFDLKPQGLVQVPAAALLFRSGGPQVARVDRSGHIAFRSVTIARDDGSVVELGSGVAPGDELALNLSSQIADGEQVKVNRPEPAAPQPSSTTGRR